MKYLSIVVMILLASCFAKKPEKTGREGLSLPGFILQPIDSAKRINTKDINNGKPAVFFLFSVYCPYCKSQLSKIEDDIKELKDLQIYMITVESYQEMKRYYETNQLHRYPNLTMCRDTAGAFAKYFDVRGIPYLALFNKELKLEKAFSGPTSTTELKSLLP